MLKKNILVVDDDLDIREALTFALESEGHSVSTANNGEEAITFLTSSDYSKHPVDCIVLDLMMPKMTGETFLKTIKERYPELKNIPIIVATAQGAGLSSEILKDTKKINKPMDINDLYDAINNI